MSMGQAHVVTVGYSAPSRLAKHMSEQLASVLHLDGPCTSQDSWLAFSISMGHAQVWTVS